MGVDKKRNDILTQCKHFWHCKYFGSRNFENIHCGSRYFLSRHSSITPVLMMKILRVCCGLSCMLVDIKKCNL